MSEDFFSIAEKYNIFLRKNGIWAYHGRTLIKQGWKIHLSCISLDAENLIYIIFPILKNYSIPFKIAKNHSTLEFLNAGHYGSTQVGKFATIYPPSDEVAVNLAKELVPLTQEIQGPTIITDLHLGGVVYTRYGGFNPISKRDRLGKIINFINIDSDSYEPDNYSAPYMPPKGIENPFSHLIQNSNIPEEKILGPGYVLLSILHANVKGNTYLALDIRNRETINLVVIKEGKQYSSSDIYGRDMRSRLLHQERLHKKLSTVIHIPKSYESFDWGKQKYLVIEFINGTDLFNLFPAAPYRSWAKNKQTFYLQLLMDICDAVHRIHNEKIIHRDLTPKNIRISSNGIVYLLDLELSWHIESTSKPFTQGTLGFVSPQQTKNMTPSTKDDIFSIGGIMIWVFASIDPENLQQGKMELITLEKRIGVLAGTPPLLTQTIAQCIDMESSKRPDINHIKKVLSETKKTFESWERVVDTTSIKNLNEKESSYYREVSIDKVVEEIKMFIPNIIYGLIHDVIKEKRFGLWLSPEKDMRSHAYNERTFCHEKVLLRSAYQGVSGPLYVLSRLRKSGWDISEAQQLFEYAIDWLLIHEFTRDDQLPGLYFGEAGVAIALTETIAAEIIDRGEWFDEYLDEALKGYYDWPDLTHGAAGQGIAALVCSDLLQDSKWADYAQNAVDYLLENQEENGSWIMPKGVSGMSGTVYLGFAHGIAGIIYFLVEYYRRFPDEKIYFAWKKAVDWFLKQSVQLNHRLSWPVVEGGERHWYSWCHGPPGIALTLLKLYEVDFENKEIYYHIISKSLDSLDEESRRHNLSVCCGLAGIGEIFLEAGKKMGKEEWILKANRIARAILYLSTQSSSEGLIWHVSDDLPTGDLMSGSSGLLHFLLRITNPNDYSFPLLVK